ncbi:hypothetical protein BH20ACT6_BH20ACT6_08340 [soil metagenome]
MVLEADRLGCVREVVVIAAALAIQGPRERPTGKEQAADAAHRRFQDPSSDLLSYLSLWQHLRDQQRAASSSKFRRMCRAEFLHYLRVREWQDLVAQLRRVLRDLDGTVSSAPHDSDRVHQALLAGLLSHIGVRQRETRDYLGARGARFAIFPGSGLAKARPAWVMAGELVETSRLWGRQVARIDPARIEPLAAHLVKRVYAEPHWERKQGAAVALETVTLYGVPIVTGRRVPLGRVDPEAARDLLIRHGLVEGDWETRYAALVRLRPWSRPRRGHGGRAAGVAAPPAGRRLRLAGARAAARPGHRAAALAAQAAAPPAGAGGCLDLDGLPRHLRLSFRVVDEDGHEVATGKDLPALQEPGALQPARGLGEGRAQPLPQPVAGFARLRDARCAPIWCRPPRRL